MAGDLLLKNAVDASAVAFWRKRDTPLARETMRICAERSLNTAQPWASG
jgi:hypothetical protein